VFQKMKEDLNRICYFEAHLNLFSKADSLWVAWVKVNLLKGRSFWLVIVPQRALRVLVLAENFAAKSC
jgi:hypothetical protein